MASIKLKISNVMSLEEKVRVIRAYSKMGNNRYKFKFSHPQIENIITNKYKILSQHSVMQKKLAAVQNAVGVDFRPGDHAFLKIALLEKVMIEWYRRTKFRSPANEVCFRLLRRKIPIVSDILNLTSFSPTIFFMKRLRDSCLKAKPRNVHEKEVSSSINDVVKYVLEQENISIEEAQSTYGIFLNDEVWVWNVVHDQQMPNLDEGDEGELSESMNFENYGDCLIEFHGAKNFNNGKEDQPEYHTLDSEKKELLRLQIFGNKWEESKTFDNDEEALSESKTFDNDSEDVDRKKEGARVFSRGENRGHDEDESMILPKTEKIELPTWQTFDKGEEKLSKSKIFDVEGLPKSQGFDNDGEETSQHFDNAENALSQTQTFKNDQKELLEWQTFKNKKDNSDYNEERAMIFSRRESGSNVENDSITLPKLKRLDCHEEVVAIKSENSYYHEEGLMILPKTENIHNEVEELPKMKNNDHVPLSKSENLDFVDVDLINSPKSEECDFVEVYIAESETSENSSDEVGCKKSNHSCIQDNFSILKNNQDAAQYLKPLKDFVTLQGNPREIDVITQLEEIFLKIAKNELDGEALKFV